MTRDQQKRQEVWADVRGYEGRYQVSNMGRVRSLPRRVKGGFFGTIPRRGALLATPPRPGTGYPVVSLSRKQFHVHALVAREFCQGEATGLVVNHKNGVKTDNRAENLEWVTQSENVAHAFRELGRVSHLKGKLGDKHPCARPIEVMGACGWLRFGSSREAIRLGYGKDPGSISRACNGLIKHHDGRCWRFAQ